MRFIKEWSRAACAALAGLCMMAVSAPSATAETTAYLTVAQMREQCADGWHQTYEAHGRTVMVDIPVQVPAAEVFPALLAELMPAAADVKVTKSNYAETEDGEYINQAGYFLYQSPTSAAYTAAVKKVKAAQMPKGYTGYPLIRHLNALEMDVSYAANNDTTVRQSQAMLEEGWKRFFPYETLELTPNWVYAYPSCRKYNGNTGTYGDEAWDAFEGPLMAYFNQCMGGIPLLCFASESFQRFTAKTFKVEDGLRAEVCAISQSYRSAGMGMFYSLQYHTLRQTAVLSENVPLCSFDKVMTTCEGLITAGQLRRVDTMRLGYAMWRKKDDSFVLMPTWVIEGELFASADATSRQPQRSCDNDPLEYGKILINAQTGELIDPWKSEKTRAYDAPSLLPWPNAQQNAGRRCASASFLRGRIRRSDASFHRKACCNCENFAMFHTDETPQILVITGCPNA